MRLQKEFFNRNTVHVARDLVGKFLVRRIGRRTIAARITETEAYRGPHDRACHASRGRTKRTEPLFGPPGSLYVYLIYGMYHCLNFVTEKEGYPAAVLIRAVDMPGGNGPGRLARTLSIDRALNALPADNEELWIEARDTARVHTIASPRIGVEYAGPWKDKPWRFTLRK